MCVHATRNHMDQQCPLLDTNKNTHTRTQYSDHVVETLTCLCHFLHFLSLLPSLQKLPLKAESSKAFFSSFSPSLSLRTLHSSPLERVPHELLWKHGQCSTSQNLPNCPPHFCLRPSPQAGNKVHALGHSREKKKLT